MKSNSRNALKSRWNIKYSKRDAKEIYADLPHDLFSTLPYGLFSERKDYRGLTLCSERKDEYGKSYNFYHIIELNDLVIDGADFSFSKFSHVFFHNCKFTHCIFDHALFSEDSRFWDNCVFESCSFADAGFIGCAFNSVSFNGCDFKKTKFKTKNSFPDARFVDCTFECNMKGVRFDSSIMERVKFIGLLEDVTFHGLSGRQWSEIVSRLRAEFGDGEVPISEFPVIPISEVSNKMDGVDFSDAELLRCTITQYCYLDRTLPPKSSKNCAFNVTMDFREKLKELVWDEFSDNDNFLDAALFFCRAFYRADPRSPADIAHIDNLKKSTGQEFSEKFYGLIVEAAKCTNSLLT